MPGTVVSPSFTIPQKALDINALKHYTVSNEPTRLFLQTQTL